MVAYTKEFGAFGLLGLGGMRRRRQRVARDQVRVEGR